MIFELIESDMPKSLGEKLAEYLSKPAFHLLQFGREFSRHDLDGRTALEFTVRNGLPLPLLYTVHAKSDGDEVALTDHIGPLSTDKWRLVLDRYGIVELRCGIAPFEIMTDKVSLEV